MMIRLFLFIDKLWCLPKLYARFEKQKARKMKNEKSLMSRNKLEFLGPASVPFLLTRRLFLFLELVWGGGLIKFYGTLIFSWYTTFLPYPYSEQVIFGYFWMISAWPWINCFQKNTFVFSRIRNENNIRMPTPACVLQSHQAEEKSPNRGGHPDLRGLKNRI